MGLSKRKELTNLVKLRSELNKLNVDDKQVETQQKTEQYDVPKKTAGSGTIIKEAKKRGRKKNELIDGSKLLCP